MHFVLNLLLNKIKEIAAKKGGFLSIENRKFLYKKMIKEKEKYYNSIINKVINGGND